MLIVETRAFSRGVRELLDEDSYRLLQLALVLNPEAGQIVRGSGGIRKLRWSASGRGKRGGARVLYYWAASRETILMLLAYPKNEREDLTAEQLRVLRRVVEEGFE